MTNWPKEIPIPHKIGKGSYLRNGEPCCAVGHLHSLGVWSGTEALYGYPKTKISQKYQEIYRQLSRILFQGVVSYGIPYINDNLSGKNRRLLYLLTWAKLGYTEGMPKNVLKLLKNPKVAAVK